MARVTDIKLSYAELREFKVELDNGEDVVVSDPSGAIWTNRSYYIGKEVAYSNGAIQYFRS